MRSVCLFALTVFPLCAQDPTEIIRRSFDRDATNFERLKNYTYQQREEDREYDADGKLKKTESETSEILILGGRPYERLVAKNDKPLSEKDAQKERDKMDREQAHRENMSASDKAKLEKERAESHKFLKEVADAYDFRLLGEEIISGKPAWKIEATPKPNYHPKDSKVKFLGRVRGTIWIDQAEYQWVKVKAEVLDTISFGFALLRVAPGGTLSLQQTRVNDEVWLLQHILVHADARVAYVKKLHTEIEVKYSDYKKFQSDSRILSADEK